MESFLDILIGFLSGSLIMGIFAFCIVPFIDRKRKENEEIKHLVEELYNKYMGDKK